MPSRFGQVWTSTVEAASVSAGDVYFLAGPEGLGSGGSSSTSWTQPTLYTEVSDGSSVWINPSYAIGNDSQLAYTTTSNYVTSNTLRLRSFGFSIPSTATITSIDIRLVHDLDPAGYGLFGARLGVGSTGYGGIEYLQSEGTPYEYTSLGLWGASWTPTQINDTDFFVQFHVESTDSVSMTVYLDYVELRINYTDEAYVSKPLVIRALAAQAGFITAAGSGAAEDSYIPVEVIIGDYNTSAALTLAGSTEPLVTNAVTATKPQLYKGSYAQVVTPKVVKRVHINPRYPLDIDLLGLERLTGNNGTTREAGTDIPFIGLHFPTAVSKALKLTLLSES